MLARISRMVLAGLLLFLGVTALGGALLVGWDLAGFPLSWLQGSPFGDYTIPALGLALVGALGLGAGIAVVTHRPEAGALSMLAGGSIVVFEIVEMTVVPPVWAQYLYLGIGVAIVALTFALAAARHLPAAIPGRPLTGSRT